MEIRGSDTEVISEAKMASLSPSPAGSQEGDLQLQAQEPNITITWKRLCQEVWLHYCSPTNAKDNRIRKSRSGRGLSKSFNWFPARRQEELYLGYFW